MSSSDEEMIDFYYNSEIGDKLFNNGYRKEAHIQCEIIKNLYKKLIKFNKYPISGDQKLMLIELNSTFFPDSYENVSDYKTLIKVMDQLLHNRNLDMRNVITSLIYYYSKLILISDDDSKSHHDKYWIVYKYIQPIIRLKNEINENLTI